MRQQAQPCDMYPKLMEIIPRKTRGIVVQGGITHGKRGTVVGEAAEVLLSTFLSASRTGLNHAMHRETQAPLLGMDSSRSSRARGTQKAVPSQTSEMAVLSLNGGLASFYGFVALLSPLVTIHKCSPWTSAKSREAWHKRPSST